MPRQRDYKAEYLARIIRGAQEGKSRSQARGHSPTDRKRAQIKFSRTLEDALSSFRESRNLTKSATQYHLSSERLRRYARENRAVRKVGSKWIFLKDKRRRNVPVYTQGTFLTITVIGFESASKCFHYMLDVGRFVNSNDIRYLHKWKGDGVIDSSGRFVPFETRPNVLYRLNATGKEPFEQIYRIVI